MLGADLVVYPELVAPLAEAIRHHVAPGGEALVLSSRRDWEGLRARGARADPADLARALARVTGRAPHAERELYLHRRDGARAGVTTELLLHRWRPEGGAVTVGA